MNIDMPYPVFSHFIKRSVINLKTAGVVTLAVSSVSCGLQPGAKKKVERPKQVKIAGIHDQSAQIEIPTLSSRVHTDSYSADVSDLQIAQQIHDAINVERQQASLPPLSRFIQLDHMAKQHSQFMAIQGVISHDGFKGRANRMQKSYRMNKAAENVAKAKGIPRNTLAGFFVTSWVKSRGHQRNLMANNNYTGVGVYTSADGTTYATQLFGK